jgi:hypothetical protein
MAGLRRLPKERGAPKDCQKIPPIEWGKHTGVEGSKPELAEIAQQLATDLTSGGPLRLWR